MIGVNGTDGKNLSTNNILIDDWVFDRKTCRPVRIAAVESNRVVLEGRPGYVSIDVLRPLELTKEILKKLGFARDMDEWWYYKWPKVGKLYYLGSMYIVFGVDILVICDIILGQSKKETFRGHILYVHELQHLFKILGLELNFNL